MQQQVDLYDNISLLTLTSRDSIKDNDRLTMLSAARQTPVNGLFSR